MTEVVAALIWDSCRFLICQRPENKSRGLLWEFVGGKVEPGETKQQALIRECREELAVEIAVNDVFLEVVHAYPDITIKLTLFNAAITSGVPRLLEHNNIAWITPNEISQYAFCPADKEILELIRLRTDLHSLQDTEYKTFQSRLIPTVEPDRIIGVRVPRLRKIARTMYTEKIGFLSHLPHKYYEEDILHAVLISDLTDYQATVQALDAFLPYVDNWAVCDTLSPKAFSSHPDELRQKVSRWICSQHPYTVRFGIGVMMKYYLDDAFDPSDMDLIIQIKRDAYYINMMRAWYFATALAKQFDYAATVLIENKLDLWTHNKAIQKAVESLRITDEQKAYLRTLRRK